MTITLTQDDLDKGKVQLRMGEKRYAEYSTAITTRQFINVSNPLGYGIDCVRAVLPIEIQNINGNIRNVLFKPVRGLAYIGCHLRRDDVRVIVARLPSGQWMFDDGGAKQSAFTLNGAGVSVSEVKAGDDFLLMLKADCAAAKVMRLHIATELLPKKE